VVTSPIRTDEVEIGSQVVFVVRRGGKPAIMEGLGICKVLQVSRESAVGRAWHLQGVAGVS